LQEENAMKNVLFMVMCVLVRRRLRLTISFLRKWSRTGFIMWLGPTKYRQEY